MGFSEARILSEHAMQLQEAEALLSLGALGAGRDPAGPLQWAEVELVCAEQLLPTHVLLSSM